MFHNTYHNCCLPFCIVNKITLDVILATCRQKLECLLSSGAMFALPPPGLDPSQGNKKKIMFMVSIRGVNRSPKISDPRKSPSPIRTSVGRPIFSGTVFGQTVSSSKAHALLDLIVL